MDRIDIKIGDITKLEVDAIVNAANKSLLGGGGVDGAIHRAAGEELLEYCRTLKGCETGFAKVSPGFNLKAKWIIHTVGPVWSGGDRGESEMLMNCYNNSLSIAEDKKLKTIAFPAISTGVYGYPKEQASVIAVKTVIDFLQSNKYPEKVIFVCFAKDDYKIYEKTLKEFKWIFITDLKSVMSRFSK